MILVRLFEVLKIILLTLEFTYIPRKQSTPGVYHWVHIAVHGMDVQIVVVVRTLCVRLGVLVMKEIAKSAFGIPVSEDGIAPKYDGF